MPEKNDKRTETQVGMIPIAAALAPGTNEER